LGGRNEDVKKRRKETKAYPVAAGELKLGTKTTNDDCSKHQGLKD
jgi:hypothetical protein